MAKFSGDANKQTFEFDLNSPTFYADTIGTAKEQLKTFRKTTGMPKALEWEIRLYDWILAQPEPNKMAERYMKTRTPVLGKPPKPKSVVAIELGFAEPYPGDV